MYLQVDIFVYICRLLTFNVILKKKPETDVNDGY